MELLLTEQSKNAIRYQLKKFNLFKIGLPIIQTCPELFNALKKERYSLDDDLLNRSIASTPGRFTKHPISIPDIIERIDANQYQTVNEFFDSIHLIYENLKIIFILKILTKYWKKLVF